jgi:hypothetical protein
MAEALAQQLSKLQLEVQNLQAQLQAKSLVTKDVSVVSLVPKWTGTDKGIPLNEFLEAVERAAWIGNWSDKDKVQVVILRLHENARVSYDGMLELHNTEITWASFKTIFLECYRDVRTDQYHFTHLQTTRQQNDESIQEFTVRCRTLAQCLVPLEEDSVKRNYHQEQAEHMLHASFISGLAGTPGRQAGFASQVQFRRP